MADRNWGNCRTCRFFGGGGRSAGDQARCEQPELRAFELKVTGASGCNRNQPRAEVAPTMETPAP